MVLLTLVRGVPGSGKSTYARGMINNGCAAIHFEADMYFTREGKYQFDKDKLKDAHAWCQEATYESLTAGHSTVISNTFTRLWEMEPYLKMCEDLNCKMQIITVDGDYDNIHGVPQDIVDAMRERFEVITEDFQRRLDGLWKE